MSLGTFAVGTVVPLWFNTRDAGTPATLSGGAAAVLKNASPTAITAGVTLTTDVGGVIGKHLVTINTAADPSVYTAGAVFTGILTAGDVGGESAAGLTLDDFSLITAAQAAITLPSTTVPQPSVYEVITAAFAELNVFLPGESIPATDANAALAKLNLILDDWNAERPCVWASTFTDYILTPNLAPHTIGPSGTFTVTSRPVSIESLSLVVNDVLTPITVRDRFWWQEQAIPDQTSAIPTDCYYNPAIPNGELWFWPVPTQASVVTLETRTLLEPVSLQSVLFVPPGYRSALTLTLAEDLAAMVGREVPAVLEKKARKARWRAFANNVQIPPLFPSEGSFDYRTRSWH